ncbi:MAG: stage III sporulation protein AB [Clostridiales bacterium]|jgi:hypothetical protein|nr:stage III sporulation protein AB [Clostridiales bacterium]
MTAAFLILSLAALAGSMTGLMFGKRLSRREAYFADAVDFINLFITEVKFRKNSTKQIVSEFLNARSTPLRLNLTEYLECGDYSSGLSLTRGLASASEAAEIKKLLLCLGTADSETQIFELENFKERFAVYAAAAADKRKKFAAVYVKLGFFGGLALGIILI